ncbi:MAG: D-xylose 1-dehydrogenase D-xylono,5-lactone-forming [Gaiellales bacterium]|jgi:predicted dehydrogenase|nr:D-xylose 1-dehydrogenase D-xylono,5-lactone-forming [Gaiellales bacterium]
MTLRIGMLSTARINANLAAGARASARTRVAAIASRQLARAEAQARELGVEKAHGSYEALLADPEIDAVYVSLPNEMHHEWAMHAIAAGKHVLCEKPYSRSPAEVQTAFAAAEAAGVVLAEAFMWRHHPQALKLSEVVAGGSIGQIRLVRAAFSFPLDDPRDVRLLEELDGGGLMDVGCYCVSAARMLAGDPVSVTAQQLRAPSGVDRRLVATLAHGGDVLAHFDCALDLANRSDLEVVGSEGALRVSDPWHSRKTGIELVRDDGHGEHFDIPAADPYACELDDLAGAIAGEHAPRLGMDDALGQARTIQALYASASSGRRVEL